VWLLANKLTVNNSKTTSIIFTNANKLIPPDVKIYLNQDVIPQVTHAKILGVEIDNKLSWKHHIDNLNKKLSSLLFIMRKIRTKITNTTALAIYNAVAKSHLTYCNLVWGRAFKSYLQLTFNMQKKLLKCCLQLPMRTPTTILFSSPKTLTLSNLYYLKVAILVFKVFNCKDQLPHGIASLFTPLSDIHHHTTRANNCLQLYKHSHNSTARTTAISISAPLIWNQLPMQLREIQSISIFKTQLKSYLATVSLNC
jgi:hypothetical protein